MIKEKPLLSIIVPIYNGEKYLRRCLNSIVNQTYKPIEVICIDDGSTDASGAICDEYQASYNQITVFHMQNMGLANARIHGIVNSSGEYVGFVDCDDWIDINMYENIISGMLNDTCIDIGIGSYVEEKKGESVERFSKQAPFVMESRVAMRKMFEKKLYLYSAWDKVYRRSLFNKASFFDKYKKYKYGEDTFLNSKLFAIARKVYYTPAWGYHYSIHDDSMMSRPFTREKLSYFRIWNDIIEDPDNQNDFELKRLIGTIIFEEGINLIRKAQEEYSKYKEDIHECIIIMKNNQYLSDYNISKHKIEYILRSFEQTRADEKKVLELVKEFCRSHKKVYIYGAGVIANEAADVLEKNGILEYDVVVSKIDDEKEMFRNKRVNSIADIIPSIGEKDGFIIALSNKNYKSVIANIDRIKREDNILNFGQYSYYYE